MYRYRLNDVPKWYFACSKVVLQKTHVPKLISYVPKLSCTETVHPFVSKLSCTESDVTPSASQHPVQVTSVGCAQRYFFIPQERAILLVKCDFPYSCAAGDKISTDLRCRAVPLIAELLVLQILLRIFYVTHV